MESISSARQIFDYFLIVGAPRNSTTTSGDGPELQAMQVQRYGEDAFDDLVLSPVDADYPGDDRMRFEYSEAHSAAESSDLSSRLLAQESGIATKFPILASTPIGWTRGSSRDPVVDLAVINRTQNEHVPDGFVCIEKTIGGYNADLNAGSISAPSMFLCYRRGRDKPPLTYVDVFCEGQDNLSETQSMELIT